MRVTKEQGAAIVIARNLAERLVVELPEIGEMYRSGALIGEISGRLGVLERYDITRDIARRAVSLAVRSLIPAEELRPLKKEHQSIANRVGGNAAYVNSSGVHANSHEGLLVLGRGLAEKNGFIPWVGRIEYENYCLISEVEYAYLLSINSEFKHKGGGNNGRPVYLKIAEEINRFYHESKPVRNRNSVQKAILKYKLSQSPQ